MKQNRIIIENVFAYDLNIRRESRVIHIRVINQNKRFLEQSLVRKYYRASIEVSMCIIYLPVLPLFKFVTSSNRSRKLLHHSRFSHTGFTGVYTFNVIRVQGLNV